MAHKLNKKSFVFQKTLNSLYKPCAVEQLDERRFVIGTYELVEPESELSKKFDEKQMRKINKRAGTIEIIDETLNISEVHECYHGGVFALKVLGGWIIAAHANGVLSMYTYSPIFLIMSFETSSTMLTSLDYFVFEDVHIFYAGSSNGLLSCSKYYERKPINNKVTEYPIIHKEPIWTVNTRFRIEPNRPLVLMGCEDSKWRLFDHCSKKIIYTNSDAEAGVTSIEVLDVLGNTVLFVGSYDGFIRVYSVKLAIKESDDIGTMITKEPIFQRIYRLDIGGGVWRIYSRVLNKNQIELFGSAMYSGAFLLTIENFDYNSFKCKNMDNIDEKIELPPDSDTSLGEVIDNNDEGKLIYGTSKSYDVSVICSYNERLIHCYQIKN